MPTTQPKSAPQAAEPNWLAQVRAVVDERYDESLRVSDLAERAGVHPVHLARVFRRRHGCTLSEYRRRLRVERAREQLERSARDLSDIALSSGFADQSHFTRCFKEITGLPPGRYRRLVSG